MSAEREAGFARLLRFFLEQKLVTFLLVLLMAGWGIVVAPFDWDIAGLPRHPVPVDAIPNLGENQQIVFTEWPGRSPQDVEDQVTYPLTVSLMGVPGVNEVRSLSMFGVSAIFMIFDEDIEFYWSRARIIEKLNSLPAGLLPSGAQPALGPDATALGQIFWYTLEGRDPDGQPVGGWDLHDLRSVQDWYVRYGLLAAEGISEVASIGGFVREIQVEVDPDALRAYGVTLGQVADAVARSNLDVGARVTEINRVEYLLRGVGFVKDVAEIEAAVVRGGEGFVPVRVGDVARVGLGPAPRRGVLTQSGAEAVGGVVVVREGYNPLQAIHNVKGQIDEIAGGLPARAVFDWERTTPAEVEAFAAALGIQAPGASATDHGAWTDWLRANPREAWPEWVTLSQLDIVPFYDRTGLIYETLATLNDALFQQMLVTIIVVLVMMAHLRASVVISLTLPLAVLVCFIAMKLFGVDSNVVSLAGIAIAIGTIVDMGIIVTENVLRHLAEAAPETPKRETVYRATREVGSAIVTAIATTVVSFLPVFTMTGAEGKMFVPLAWTKTFVLVGAILAALLVAPALLHLMVAGRDGVRKARRGLDFGFGLVGVAAAVGGFALGWTAVMAVGLGVVAWAVWRLVRPEQASRAGVGRWLASALAAVGVGLVLSVVWEPLGPERGLTRNAIFVAGLIGGLLGGFALFHRLYPHLLRAFLLAKGLFISIPLLLTLYGLTVWMGFDRAFPVAGPVVLGLVGLALIHDLLAWLRHLGVPGRPLALARIGLPLGFLALLGLAVVAATRDPDRVRLRRPWVWAAHEFPGLGREFMPTLDEGSFLWMPTTMPHASVGEALEVLRHQDMAIAGVPEVESVTGKIGRAESPLDPAPVSMIETVIHYRPEYISDEAGRRINFRYDRRAGEFVRDEDGELIPDRRGQPYRQWRDHIRRPRDIWDEIARVAAIPGTTSAPPLQPIETRLVMLQTGMRAPMGLKIRAPDLETLDRMAVELERRVREVPAVNPGTVNADRVVGKPYLEIVPDREAIARYGVNIQDVHMAMMTAVGGREVTTTVEGRERYPVRVRYPRELRDDPEAIRRTLVHGTGGAAIPLGEVAEIRFVRGPQMIRSEDTFLSAYVTFSGAGALAEVEVVEQVRDYLDALVAEGRLAVPPGVSWRFAGSYEHQLRAARTLRLILPVSMAIIFLILYFQFRAVSTTFIVFSGIAVAWAGGFVMIYLYGQDWFANVAVFGVNLRDLFQLRPVNLSVAVWVGFLALFGIAVDDGVVISTYLMQSFRDRRTETVEQLRKATVAAGMRRVRPCLMTSATTILALLPVMTSTGRGAEIMIPMAIPSLGGMSLVIISMFTVPVLFCWVEEFKLKRRMGEYADVGQGE